MLDGQERSGSGTIPGMWQPVPRSEHVAELTPGRRSDTVETKKATRCGSIHHNRMAALANSSSPSRAIELLK